MGQLDNVLNLTFDASMKNAIWCPGFGGHFHYTDLLIHLLYFCLALRFRSVPFNLNGGFGMFWVEAPSP